MSAPVESTARRTSALDGRPAEQARRRDASGVEGNARLTAMAGALLFVLLAAEGFTVLRIGPLLKVHVFLGALLIPPVAVKLASTVYRFGRYYKGVAAYRRKGPPPMVLRLLGPVLVVLTVVLFTSGVALLFVGPAGRGTWSFLHKASFILWFGVMTIHVLGHLVETGRLAPRDFRRATRQGRYRGALRQLVLFGAVAVGGVMGAALVGRAGHYFL